jgi:hypothetical protein
MLAHRRVEQVFAWMVDRVRVDGHVMHDVAQELHVRLPVVRDVPAFGLEQVEQPGEVAVILAQFVEDSGELDAHCRFTSFYRRYHAFGAAGG